MPRLLRLSALTAIACPAAACEEIPGLPHAFVADHVAASPPSERLAARPAALPGGTYAYPAMGNVFYPLCGLVDASTR